MRIYKPPTIYRIGAPSIFILFGINSFLVSIMPYIFGDLRLPSLKLISVPIFISFISLTFSVYLLWKPMLKIKVDKDLEIERIFRAKRKVKWEDILSINTNAEGIGNIVYKTTLFIKGKSNNYKLSFCSYEVENYIELIKELAEKSKHISIDDKTKQLINNGEIKEKYLTILDIAGTFILLSLVIVITFITGIMSFQIFSDLISNYLK